MLKSRMLCRLLLVLLALTLPGISASAQSKSPTDAELISTWESMSRAGQVAALRTLWEVEHAVPSVPKPRYLAVLSGSDLYLHPYYESGLGYDLMTVGPWEYHVTWPDETLKGWLPKPKPRLGETLLIDLGILAVGAVIGYVAHK